METLYKWTRADGRAPNGGSGTWSLPNERPGRWWHVKGEVEPCRNGLHLCRASDLLTWIPDGVCALHEVEWKGKRIDCDDKVVVRSARLVRTLPGWNETTSRLFAADCAESVLYIYEAEHPGDGRPREAIDAARAYAHSQIDAAASAAAWAASNAASAAAWAARTAAWDALSARLILYAEKGEDAMYEPLPDMAGVIEGAAL